LIIKILKNKKNKVFERKLITLLAALSSKMQQRFSIYVHSPFFNKHQASKDLVAFLMPYAPNFESPKLSAENVFAAIFPNQSFSSTKLNYVVSKVLDLLSQFLAYEEYKKNPLREKYYALKAAHELGISKQTSSHIRQHERLQQQQQVYSQSISYYESYLYHNIRNQMHLDGAQRLYDKHLQVQNDNLDFYYLAQKLKIACDMLSRNVVIQADYHPSYLGDWLQWIEQEDFPLAQHPIIHIYYQILKTLQENKDSDYQQLKQLILSYSTAFIPEELLLIYDYAENFCIRKINNGQTNYYYEFLALYKQKLARSLLFKDGYLPESDYKNIVTAGVRIKDFEWTENFIHQNKKHLNPKIRENAFNYNLAVFYYAQQAYTKALRLLATINFTDIAYGVGAKTIQLQSYYELHDTEPLLNLVDTFRLYVIRHKTQSDYRKKATLNMLKIVKKVAKLREKSTFYTSKQFDKEQQKLLELYQNTSPLSNADWVHQIIIKL